MLTAEQHAERARELRRQAAATPDQITRYQLLLMAADCAALARRAQTQGKTAAGAQEPEA